MSKSLGEEQLGLKLPKPRTTTVIEISAFKSASIVEHEDFQYIAFRFQGSEDVLNVHEDDESYELYKKLVLANREKLVNYIDHQEKQKQGVENE
jgi:hypothetical protein